MEDFEQEGSRKIQQKDIFGIKGILEEFYEQSERMSGEEMELVHWKYFYEWLEDEFYDLLIAVP